jgi:hypothetical protein
MFIAANTVGCSLRHQDARCRRGRSESLSGVSEQETNRCPNLKSSHDSLNVPAVANTKHIPIRHIGNNYYYFQSKTLILKINVS